MDDGANEANGDADTSPSAANVPGQEFTPSEPQANVMWGLPVPSAVEVGRLGEAPSNALPSPATFLTGDVALMDGLFAVPVDGEVEKKSFRWRQFFLGLCLPYAVLFSLLVVGALNQPNYEDMPSFSRTERAELEPNEDEWVVYSVEREAFESMNFWFDLGDNEEEERTVSMYFDPFDDGWSGNGVVHLATYNRTTRSFAEEDIGQFYTGNSTLAFALENSSFDGMEVYFNFHDYVGENAWWEAQSSGVGERLFELCLSLTPFIYCIGVVAAFVKGNKGLGVGLLTALPMAIVGVPLLFLASLLLLGSPF